MPAQIDLGDECLRQVEVAFDAVISGNLLEQLVDGRHPEGVEHLLLGARLGIRHVRVDGRAG